MSVAHFTAGKSGIQLCYTIEMLPLHETRLCLLLIHFSVLVYSPVALYNTGNALFAPNLKYQVLFAFLGL